MAGTGKPVLQTGVPELIYRPNSAQDVPFVCVIEAFHEAQGRMPAHGKLCNTLVKRDGRDRPGSNVFAVAIPGPGRMTRMKRSYAGISLLHPAIASFEPRQHCPP